MFSSEMEEHTSPNLSEYSVDLELLDEFLSLPGFDYPSSPILSSEPDDVSEMESNCVQLYNSSSTITSNSSVQERLAAAIRRIKETQIGSEVLVQIWVPTEVDDQQVLTTYGQPFSIDSRCHRLVSYRNVSMNYQFVADERSRQAVGLPGRVFLGKVPEWSPDVRYFSAQEYPRVSFAQQLDVRGTIALPIFERGSGRSCLGVVEVVMTRQKVNYGFEVESICNALQAVDFRTSEVSKVPRVEVGSNSYHASLPEIKEVLRVVCEMHRLPLAQTWTSCNKQGRTGSRHSDDNYKDCISTIDEACLIRDPNMLDFHHACSEHHLFIGQGVAGKAFITNQPCFSSDITTFSKIEYPLSHHAKLFNLRAAVAIRLRSAHTGKIDFVLELFLPIHCIDSEHQKLMLNSLSITLQQVCRSLRVVMAKESEEESVLERTSLAPSDVLSDKSISEVNNVSMTENHISAGAPEIYGEASSWVRSATETREKETKSKFFASLPSQFKQDIDRFSITSQWDTSEVLIPVGKIFSELEQKDRDSNLDRTSEKKRMKTEKNVSLQELRKYFAGSLKDAAKSLGVCPTTLKRICRQHGISRWPSRKIKKVGHSLKKLQSVLDSVHGPEAAVQLTSLYENFSKSNWSDDNAVASSSMVQNDQLDAPVATKQQESRLSSHNSGLSSPSTSCSQSSTSSLGYTSTQKQSSHAHEFTVKQEIPIEDRQSGMLTNVYRQTELHLPTDEIQNPKIKSQHPQFTSTSSLSPSYKSRYDSIRVKAILGEDKIVFRLQPSWGFEDLRQEVVRRFGLLNTASVDLKYLDDDSEWVLLTCDEDLQECIDVYKSTDANTIRISVTQQQSGPH